MNHCSFKKQSLEKSLTKPLINCNILISRKHCHKIYERNYCIHNKNKTFFTFDYFMFDKRYSGMDAIFLLGYPSNSTVESVGCQHKKGENEV